MSQAASSLMRATRNKESRRMTYAEFMAFIQEDQKGDLIDGVAKIMSPATYQHERLFGILFTLLSVFINRRGLGQILGSRSLVRIDEHNGYEPDLLFVARERLGIIHDLEIIEGPDLVVEIVSPSSRTDDYARKFTGYERAGVGEYWIIDPLREEATFYVRREERLEEVHPEGGTFRSEAVPGFYLRPEWIFTEEKLDELALLEEMLKRPLK